MVEIFNCVDMRIAIRVSIKNKNMHLVGGRSPILDCVVLAGPTLYANFTFYSVTPDLSLGSKLPAPALSLSLSLSLS